MVGLLMYSLYFYPRSPCGERHWSSVPVVGRPEDFYPRSPCGERLVIVVVVLHIIGDFYPRSPCGERQARRASRQQPAGISIHALLAESDLASRLVDMSAA